MRYIWCLMSEYDLDEVAENIRILVREELETQHWLEGHSEPVPDCPVCESHLSAT